MLDFRKIRCRNKAYGGLNWSHECSAPHTHVHVHSGFKQCAATKEALSVTVYLSCSMPLVLKDFVYPDDRFMIVVMQDDPFYDQVTRYLVIFIQGICSLAECRSFVSECSPEAKDFPPSARRHFQHHDFVNVSTCGFMSRLGEYEILDYFGEVFDQREFTDAYTFHVSKHSIESYSKECWLKTLVRYV